MRRVFLLSPARVNGVRAGLLTRPGASFDLAVRFQREGLPLAEVFTFASGLYFRGKITYARRFISKTTAVRVITTNAGLVPPDLHVTPEALLAFGDTDIDPADPRYQGPLLRDAEALAQEIGPKGQAILLGSIATGKYRDVLLQAFGARLVFPEDFVGRGDMSRGGLLLRAAAGGTELPYISVAGAVTRGKRPAKLEGVKRSPEPTKKKPAQARTPRPPA